MRRIWPIIALSLVLPLPALGQAIAVPAPPYYAMEPTMPLTPSARSPVQQQILENDVSHRLHARAPR